MTRAKPPAFPRQSNGRLGFPVPTEEEACNPHRHSSLSRFNREVRPRLMRRHGTPLPSRGFKEVSGFLSRGHRGLGLFLEVPQFSRNPSLRVLSPSSGFQSSPCRGIRLIWSGWGNWGLFKLRHDCWGCARVSRGDRPPPEGHRQHRDSFPEEAGESTLISLEEGENGALLELWREIGVPL